MIRRRYGRTLSRAATASEDVNPNAYITNLADCMLVLVLGLLVALITKYNVDLQQAPVDNEFVGIEVDMDANDDGVIDDAFEERGSVYYDKENNKYYLLTD